MPKARRQPSLPTIIRSLAPSDQPYNHDLAERAVADPYQAGRFVTATASLRDDPLARLHVRNQIDDAQFAAGRHVQRLIESSEVGTVKAMDAGKPFVDGGRGPEPVSDQQIKAGRDLQRVRLELGGNGYTLVRSILGDRMFIEQYAAMVGDNTQRSRDFFARRFRECLDTLAAMFGYTGTGPQAKRPRDSAVELARYSDNPGLHAAVTAARKALYGARTAAPNNNPNASKPKMRAW